MKSSTSLAPKNLEALQKAARKKLFERDPLELVGSGLLMIKTKEGAIKSFSPNYAQKIVLSKIREKRANNNRIRFRFLKARQLGISTLVEAIIYAYTSRREGFNSLVIADDDSGSSKLFELNKLFHERLSSDFRPRLKKSNAIALEFERLNSRIDIETARNKNAGRGDTYQIVHKSESSRFPYPTEVNLGIANAVPDHANTMIFDESTANGFNHFYDDCKKAESGEDGFELIFLPWFYDQLYALTCYVPLERNAEEVELCERVNRTFNIELSDAQLNWRRYAIREKCGGDKNLFKQEYPSTVEEAFLSTGRAVFDTDRLIKMRDRTRFPIRQEGLLDIYEEPNLRASYALGCDTSEGLIDGDASSVVILNAHTKTVAAEYNGKLPPNVLASHIFAWGNLYNEALAVIESNNHGIATLYALKELHYYRIYSDQKFDAMADKWTDKIGFKTTSLSKPVLIGKLDKFIRDGGEIPSKPIIEELVIYAYHDDGSTNAPQGKHDDRVIATALAVQGLGMVSHELLDPKSPEIKPNTAAWIIENIRLKKEQSRRLTPFRARRSFRV